MQVIKGPFRHVANYSTLVYYNYVLGGILLWLNESAGRMTLLLVVWCTCKLRNTNSAMCTFAFAFSIGFPLSVPFCSRLVSVKLLHTLTSHSRTRNTRAWISLSWELEHECPATQTPLHYHSYPSVHISFWITSGWRRGFFASRSNFYLFISITSPLNKPMSNGSTTVNES